MKKLFAVVALCSVLFGCQNATVSETKSAESIETPTSDVFYHYSVWYAFVNRVFEGELLASELKTKGDLGLGSYDLLDGELIMLDGVLYKATEDGVVSEARDSDKIVYANAAFFDTEQSFTLEKAANYQSLREQLNAQLPSRNLFYAFKIHGTFKHMKCGGLHKQEKPFDKGLDVLIPARPIFERSNFSGTMVGFFCPEFIGHINVAAYHLHFISDDKQFAGHVMEFEAEKLEVEIDYMHQYQFDLPTSDAFLKGEFEKEFQYQNN